MFGTDTERIMGVLNKLKDETSKQIRLLGKESDYRMETIDHSHNVLAINGGHGDGIGVPQEHTHAVPGISSPTGASGSDGYVSKQLTYEQEWSNEEHFYHPHNVPYVIYEREHRQTANNYTQPIIDIGEELKQDLDKMKKIEDKMYVKKDEFNVKYGSPWQEVYILKEKIDEMKQYGEDFPNLQWLGEKHTLMALMQIVLSYTIDCKWAITYFHDWIQRGYDHQENNNKPSIVWDYFENTTIGNREQEYDENVVIPEKSKDPF
jgi:hypothetical protein